MTQEVIDYGWNDYVNSFDDYEYVDVGILTEAGAQKRPPKDGKQTDITLAGLAAIQEYGTQIQVTAKMRGFLSANGLDLSQSTQTITIPARPFMRQTFDENESMIFRMVDEKDRLVMEGKTTRKAALNEIGQTHRQQIQKAMSTQGKFKANHPYTVDKKGSSMPLIDTGGLRQAIDYEVG